MKFTRRFFLSCLTACLTSVAVAEAPLNSPLPAQRPDGIDALPVLPKYQTVEDLLEKANLTGTVSFAVIDGQSGEVLDALEPSTAHPPASVTKALTTLYGFGKLGTGARFRTLLRGTGPIENGVLKGGLILQGGGDPTLTSDNMDRMARRLKLLGVTSIEGRFLVYPDALPQIERIDPAQPEQVGYNSAISGLNMNFNRVYLEWRRAGSSYKMTMDGRTEDLRPRVVSSQASTVNRELPVFTYQSENGRDIWTVARQALGNAGGRWLPVRNPAIYAGDILQTVARSHGIKLPYPEITNAQPKGRILADRVSGDLLSVCKDMLKFSTNLTAEVVGLRASGIPSEGASLKISAEQMSAWLSARYDVDGVSFVDHSGLGDASRISPENMVQILRNAGLNGPLREILKPVRLHDNEGKPIEDNKAQVVAKTGTLNFVSALAGYIRTPSNRDLVFAIFISDTPRRAALKKSEKENSAGSKSWNRRAKILQNDLINRWIAMSEEAQKG